METLFPIAGRPRGHDHRPAPPPLASKPAVKVIPRLVQREVKRLRTAARETKRHSAGTGDHPALHEARKDGKRLRYAAEAAEPVNPKRAARLADAAQGVQKILGDHQDSVVTRELACATRRRGVRPRRERLQLRAATRAGTVGRTRGRGPLPPRMEEILHHLAANLTPPTCEEMTAHESRHLRPDLSHSKRLGISLRRQPGALKRSSPGNPSCLKASSFTRDPAGCPVLPFVSKSPSTMVVLTISTSSAVLQASKGSRNSGAVSSITSSVSRHNSLADRPAKSAGALG